MTTPILGIPELADGQINQFATANEAFRALEAAGNEFTTVNLTGGNVTLTAAQFSAALLFRSSGNSVARDLTIPQAKRLFIVNNGGSAALSVKRGSTTINIAIGAYSLLYSDGTANGLAVAGGGGGGLINFTDAVSASAPNATVPVSSLTATNAAADVDAALCPKGLGALLGDISDNAISGGNKRGPFATDWQRGRAASTQVASGDSATLGGGINNTASGTRTTVGGGEGNTASGNYGSIGGGLNNTASQQYATVGGGNNNQADGTYATIIGGYAARTRGILGAEAYASGFHVSFGDAQRGRFILRAATSNATPTALTSNGAAVSAVNIPVMPDTSAYLFKARIVARSSGEAAAYELTGLIRRGANAAATALEGAPTLTVIAESAGATAWTAGAVADTTNGALQIQVTGAAATSIKWVADVETVEVVG